MAIDPPSDIVLEVARAADPTRAAAVAQKLSALAAGGPTSGADFAAALNEAGGSTPGVANMRARLADAKLAASEKAGKAEVQFESVLLNNFISEMLPKDEPEAYGQGTAGEMWRSMLSEKISDEIAKSGELGISRRLFEGAPDLRRVFADPCGAKRRQRPSRRRRDERERSFPAERSPGHRRRLSLLAR